MKKSSYTPAEIVFPSNLRLHQIFESYAKNQPEKTALVFDGKRMSYAEMNLRANQLAHCLHSLGAEPDQLIAVCIERSFDMMIAIFGILKAGAAYVPIDVDYPTERLQFMIKDANAKIILTQSHLVEKLPDGNDNVICLDTDWEKLIAVYNGENAPRVDVQPQDLAYTIYTSGSTGKPKGVMISHDNVVNQLEGQQDIAPAPITQCLLTCSISFDVSVLTIFWTLLQGATLVLPKQGEEKDIARLAEIIFREKVSHILTLPSLHTLILDQAPPEKLQSVRLINVSGEVCPTSLAQRHERLLPKAQLYNLYGPTEATVNCTFFTIPKGYNEAKVPIGIPIKNYDIFILDKNLKEVPRGEVGQIYIGGSKPVVGRGYWNRPKLSAERFIKNPFKGIKGGDILYNTGDLARWMPNGNIEFLGRSDFQVKFRGFRIELGEIEVAVSNHPAVREVVVLLKNQHELNKEKLVVYLTLNKGYQLNVSELRAFLSETLPEYMQPSAFVFMDKMPLTTNGKFNRKALPEPPNSRPDLTEDYVAPETDLEKYLTNIWERILSLSPIGKYDKFFELGGNSIQAAQFIGELQTKLETSIFITTIFDNPTIEEYAALLEKSYTKSLDKLWATTANEQKEKDLLENYREAQPLTPEQIDEFSKYIPPIPKSSVKRKLKTNPPAIFILAPPRSGTTLLRVMLAGHPDLFAANELQLLGFHTLKDRRKAYSGKFALWLEGLVRAVMELKDCTADEAKALIEKYEQKGYTTQQFFALLQSWIGNKVLVDKSPSYALDPAILEKAEQEFDNAIYIHLVRHPYAMVTSLEKYHLDQVLYLKEHPYDARQVGELVWLKSHQNINQFLQKIPQHRQFRIIYEDLVTQPEQVMDALCHRIGLPYHSNLLQPYADMEHKMMDGIYQNSRSMGDTNLLQQKAINPALANKWRGVIKDNFLCPNTWLLTSSFGYPMVGDLPQIKRVPQQAVNQKPKIINHKSPDYLSDISRQAVNRQSSTVAIIGMSCRLPGANNIKEFWENLVNGTDVSYEVTPEALQKAGIRPDEWNTPNRVKRTLALENPEYFDAAFFGYHPKEAAMMDPQHRVFLEAAYTALENAGYDPYSYNGKIGIYGGVSRNAYFTNNIASHPENLAKADEYVDMIGNEKSFSITRVAYKLNLKGPAVNIQTACSTTGVSVHLACQSLQNGDADMMLVGGGRIQPNLLTGYQYTEGGPLSPDGYLRAFDADANGMVKGNGMVFIVLKPLDKALADGDHIWATIKSTAINNDGSDKIGFTAPGIKGQADVITTAQQKAGIPAASISYIETHGTGTLLGDPIEFQGLNMAFGETTQKKQFCAIGSVKTNIGHLDAGACVAGIIKTALALKFELLPASLNFKKPNPQINFENSPFYVNNTLQPWLKNGHPRRAGVSSFGLGGTNAHIILEEAPWTANGGRRTVDGERQVRGQHHLLLLSAKTEKALNQISANLEAYLQADATIYKKDVAFTLAVGRPHFKHRKAVLIAPHPTSNNNGQTQHWLTYSNAVKGRKKPHIVFMFPGGGAQYLNMAKDLYHSSAFFKKQVDKCAAILVKQHGLRILPLLFPLQSDNENLRKELEKPSLALATLFTIEYSLATSWMHWGIHPDEMIGHSMGEYTAACIAGVFSLEDALALVTIRGFLFEQLPAESGMLSVPLSERAVAPYLNGGLSVAVINKPDSCVVSGKAVDIDKLQRKLTSLQIDSTRIRIAVAAHSAQIDPILEKFYAFLEKVKFGKPQIPFISNTTGTWAKNEEVIQPEYWIKHLRQTVRFSDGLATLLQKSEAVFLEVGPGQTLSTFARQHPAKQRGQTILASLRHPKESTNDIAFLNKTLAKLWLKNAPLNWHQYYENARRIPLPTYPFERKRFWIEPARGQTGAGNQNSQILNQKNQISNISNQNSQIPNAMLNTLVPLPPSPQPVIPQQSAVDIKPSAVSRKENLIKEIHLSLQDLSGLEPEDMEVQASFLELGFDSLFLSQVLIQLNKKFDTTLSFRQLFEEAASIDALAGYLDGILEEGLFEAIGSEQSAVDSGQLAVGSWQLAVGSWQLAMDSQQLAVSGQQTTLQPNPIFTNNLATPVFNPIATPSNSPVLQQIINQQLQIMQQQLALLGGQSQITNQISTATGGNLQTTNPPIQNQQAVPTNSPIPQSSNSLINQSTNSPKKGVTAKLKQFGKGNSNTQLTDIQQQNLQDFIKKYCAKTKGSKKQAKLHRQYYSDPRTLTGFNKNWKEIIYQLAGDRSKGSRFWDVDGNEYIDFVMSYGVALFGHSPDFVQEAVIRQIQKGTALDLLSPLATDLGKMLCELSGMDRMTLANTGTEAVVGAVRAARAATGKDKIAVFDTDYHGLTDEFLIRGISLKGKMRPMPLAAGIPKYVAENILLLDYDDPDVLQKIKENASDLAAVLIEPVQAQNPHWQHHDLIKQIRQLTAEQDIALVFDEIINGFRLHQQGAQYWYDVQPDIITYGKSISGGLPLAAIVGKARYMEVYDGGLWQFGDDSAPEGTVTYYAGTFIKNPVSVAAAHAAVSEIQKRGKALQLELNAKTQRFVTRLQAIFDKTNVPFEVQSESSFFILKNLDSNPSTNLIYHFLRYHGVNMRARPCFISDAHSEEDLEKTLEIVEKAVVEMMKRGLLRQSAVGSKQSAVGSKQSAVGSKQSTVDSGQSVNGREEQVNGLPASANGIEPSVNGSGNSNGSNQIQFKYELTASNLEEDNLSRDSGINPPALPTRNSSTLSTEPFPAFSNETKTIPLTEGQQEIFLNDRFSRAASAAYNIATEITLEGNLNLEKLKNAIEQIVNRHEALRTTISEDGKTQHIAPVFTPNIQFADLSELPQQEQQEALNAFYDEEAEHEYDLQNGPLVRFKIIKIASNKHLVFINVHHIICDGWSLGIITRELGEIYAGDVHLKQPKQLSDYAFELENFKSEKVFYKNEKYWLNEFESGVPVLELPTDFPRPAIKTYPGAIEKLRLSPEFYQQLRKTAAKQGTTFYVFMLSAFHAFLSRISQQEDFVIGVAAAGHNLPGNQLLVGHCINLLPVRIKADTDSDFKTHLKNVRGKILDAFDHQQYTFGTLVKKLKVARSSSRNTLVSVAFNMDSPLNNLNYGGLQATTKAIPRHYETFDSFINLKPVEDYVDFEWNYNSDLFRSESIRQRLAEFETLLLELAQVNPQPIRQLPLLPKHEKQLLAQFGNGIFKAFPAHKTLHQLMEEQAFKTPKQTAIVFGKQTLSYKQLNQRSNQVAHFLIQKGLKKGTTVGVSLERSLEMLVAIFGVLKAGGAYVPMDARNPKKRLKLMLEDSECAFLLTQKALLPNMPSFTGDVLAIDQIPLHRCPKSNPIMPIAATDMAYIIYTSGSTGLPKGVAIRHESAINTLLGINEHLKMDETDVLYSVSSMSFDMSIPDYFLAPAVGAKLILAEESTKKDGFLLKEDIEKQQPTVMQATPTTWKILLLAGWQGDKNMTIVAGGEGFPKGLAADLVEKCKAVWNGYGPTETTIYTTYKKVTKKHLAEMTNEFAAIGKPIANVETLILDKNLQPTPVGVPGELYIGGPGVSKGYLHREELTAKMFIQHPFSSNKRLYKTGDLVRYLPNGDIDFLGRIDHQVKIRGFRIELGEIEEVLKQAEGVSQAAVKVVSDKNGDKRLAAYAIMKDGFSLNEEDVKVFLRSKLPGFMVPAFYMQMTEFPLSTSLKVDRKALPKPDIQSAEIYVAPQTPMEKMLAQLFEEVLDLEQVGINDDFFELGGHSLVAVELMSKIQKATEKKLPLTTLFQNPTVKQLAALLSGKEEVLDAQWKSLIPIRNTGNKAPIYLVHGGGLHVLFYQTLVKYLDADQPVYALQAKGLNGDEEPLDSIEEMAANYIQEMISQNPDGPYSLAGYSLGGLIAYEMARQLKAMGKEIKILALFDVVAKEATVEGTDSKWLKRMKKTGYNIALMFKNPVKAMKYKSHVLQMQYQHLMGKLSLAYRNNQTNEIEEGYLPYGKKVYEKSMQAFEKYQLQPIDVTIDLFKAQDQMFYLKDFEYLGWQPFAKAGIRVHEVPGDHLTLFDAPSDRVIGEKLRDLLKE